jgi:hypothetical protein
MWKSRSRRKDDVRMDLRETELDGVDWVHLAQDRDQCLAFVNTVIKTSVSLKVNFLTS